MTETPYPRLDVSKVGLLVGAALIAFGLYATISYFRSGGHGLTALRAVVALPVGAVAIVLSFSTVCSGCGARLETRTLSTSAPRASEVWRAAETSDGAALVRALGVARGERGSAKVGLEACPRCQRLVRTRADGGTRVLSGEPAGPAVAAVLALPAGD